MTEAEFNQIWIPRIGAQAAAQLRRSGNLILLVMPMVFACGIALGALDGLTATFTLVFWILAVVVSLLVFGVWLYSRIVLARALSQWFGRKLSWFTLPRLSPASFDRWCRRRQLQPPGSAAPPVVSAAQPAAVHDIGAGPR